MNRDLLERLISARHDRRAVALVTDLETGAQRLVGEDDAPEDMLSAALLTGFRFDRSGVTSTEEGEFFVNIYNPPLTLVVVGAVHIAQSLVPIARLAGYDVTVIDPRGAFASAERFPGVTLSVDWPDEALKSIELDRRTGFVALTHDPKIDDPALTIALQRTSFYVGALGSKKTHAGRLERLEAAGVEADALARIHAPIGLAIGARGPAEIAIAIMAEMTKALRQEQ